MFRVFVLSRSRGYPVFLLKCPFRYSWSPTRHSRMPAETSGFSSTTSRTSDAVTGSNNAALNLSCSKQCDADTLSCLTGATHSWASGPSPIVGNDAMRTRVEAWAAERGPALGVAFLPRANRRSWTVSCLKLLNPAVQGSAVSKGMKGRGYVIASGYGKLKETTFRIGHMGDHTVGELDALLGVLGEVLRG